MSNSWSGFVAKSITSKKRPKSFWNIFFIIAIIIVLSVMCVFIYQVASEHFKHDSEQVFVEYKNGYLTTDSNSFKIHENDKQEIKISKLIQLVDEGDKITLTISNLSGDLLEIKYLNEIVYKKEPIPIAPTVIMCVFLVFPMLGFFIFMLVVTNMKSPGKKIAKIQNQFLLKFYK